MLHAKLTKIKHQLYRCVSINCEEVGVRQSQQKPNINYVYVGLSTKKMWVCGINCSRRHMPYHR
jgi:hypothetical protein